jgi:hypothetical protein
VFGCFFNYKYTRGEDKKYKATFSPRRCHRLPPPAAEGKLGGKAPYGYRLAADGVSLEEHPEEQAIIRQAKALRTEGYSIRQIGKKLGPVSRAGKPFTVAAVHKLVRA